MKRHERHRDGLVILRLSSYEQMTEVADGYRRGDPVAVLVSSEDLKRRAADFMSGLAIFNLGSLRKITGNWWLIRPPGRRLTVAETKVLTDVTGTSQGLDEP